MKLGIVLAYENTPYAGVVRPFINWAKFLTRFKSINIKFLLVRVGKDIITALEKEKINFTLFKNTQKMIKNIKNEKYDIIFSDDYIKRLKIFEKINNPSIKKVVYVQVLHGVHSFVDIFSPVDIKERLIYQISKLIPFLLIKKKYCRIIKNHVNLVIANSQITATLLHMLYGVEPHGIVYPPVDTTIFKPQNVKKKNQVLLYLGSHAGDTDENFVKKICKILNENDFKILAMGNKLLRKKLSKYFKIYSISGILDHELAKIYSECKLVICPQKWEQFGYVVAESIACETPVLAFNLMGPKEIIEATGFGLLANNKEEMLNLLKNFDEKIKNLRIKSPFQFELRISSEKLLSVIEKHV